MWPARMCSPSTAWAAGTPAARDRMAGSTLGPRADTCRTTRIAASRSGATPARSVESASTPPAEAPMATTALGAAVVASGSPLVLHAVTDDSTALPFPAVTSETAVDERTGRKYYLDLPEDPGAGELTFLLNIHGGGSAGVWQRGYFPAHELVDSHRLVVAAPTAATAEPMRHWAAEADDEHLRNI